MQKNIFLMRLFILFVSCIVSICSTAQPIKGIVKDASTQQPIAGASVFVVNTTYGTVCNESGVFVLSSYPSGKINLTITAVGYQPKQIEMNSNEIPSTIDVWLQVKINEMSEVVVSTAEKDGWQKFGADFIKNFIGTSSFANQCEIKNKNDLKFYYDKNEMLLKVKSSKPLIIKNNALGYEINYWIETFELSYQQNTVFKAGALVFTPLKGNKKKQEQWNANRELAYRGSLNHFFSSLYKGTLAQEGFEVRILKRVDVQEAKNYLPIKRDTVVFGDTRFNELMYEISAKDQLSSAMLKDLFMKWFTDSLNKTAKPGFIFNLKPATPEAEVYEFKRDIANSNKLFVENYPSSLLQNARNKKMDFLVDKIIKADSLLTIIDSNTKQLNFTDYWHITYNMELEEAAYLIELNPFRKVTPGKQTSIISILNPNGIYIFENGNFENAIDLLAEKYWSYEKIDKIMPLDYKK